MTPADLAGRVAVVTGASRGVGRATAQRLDAAGARVVLVARDEGALREVAGELSHDPIALPADLAAPEEAVRVATTVIAAAGGVDILVNNAAVAMRRALADTDAATIDAMHAVNVRAPLLLTRALVPSMAARGGGAIVNLSSVSGQRGAPHRVAYAATKGAIEAATRALAMELGPVGVRVNAVAPGVVDTAMWAKQKAVPGVVESVEALTPLARWATADDVADVIVFLVSDSARFVTGVTLNADGGMAQVLDLYA